MSMLVLSACLLAGFAFGRLARLPQWVKQAAGWALSACLFALVFVLGYKLGSDAGLLPQFGAIGAGALVLAAGCTAGSILAVKAFLWVRAAAGSGAK